MHAGRKSLDEHYHKPSATTTEALDRIGGLYRTEETIRGKPPYERRRVCKDDALKAWIVATLQRPLAKTYVAKAMRYALARCSAVSRYLYDGAVETDNSAAEKSIRGGALGHKNWFLLGWDADGVRAATIYSLIETSK